MPSRRRLAFASLIALGLLAGLAGCADSVSPSARAWERSCAQMRSDAANQSSRTLMAAGDGLGATIFSDSAQSRTVATVHNE